MIYIILRLFYSRRKVTKKKEHTQTSSQLFAKKIDLIYLQ